MPCPAGSDPVAIDAELIRVTVGKTAWLSLQRTPRWASSQRLGVSSGEIRSGRMPSQTITKARLAALTLLTPSQVGRDESRPYITQSCRGGACPARTCPPALATPARVYASSTYGAS